MIWDVGMPFFASFITIYNYIVIAAGSNSIIAYFLNNGAKVWYRNLTSTVNTTGYITMIPTVGGDNVVVVSLNSPNALVALNAVNGAYLWSLNLTSFITATPAYGDGYFYFGTSNGKLYAVSPNGSVKWVDDINIPVLTTPAIADGRLYAGLGNGTFLAINDATGATIWGGDTFNSPITAPPIVSTNGIVYIGTEDGNVYAINANNGAILSKYSTGYTIVSLALDGGGYLIALDSQANIYIFK